MSEVTQPTRKRRKTAAQRGAAVVLGVAALGGGSIAAADDSEAIELSTIGSVLSTGKAGYDFYALCKSNMDHDLSCLKSTGDTVNDIYTNLNKLSSDFSTYTAKYEKDSAATTASLNAIIKAEKDAATKAAFESIRGDLEVAHVGTKIYDAYLDCFTVAAKTASEGAPETGTCKNVSVYGVSKSAQPATAANVERLKNMLVENETNNPAVGTVGYKLAPTDVLQRIGGKSTTARDGDGLLHAVTDEHLTKERLRQGVHADSNLTVHPASLVNAVNAAVKNIGEAEAGYVATRVAAMNFRETEESQSAADDLLTLAQEGRADNSAVLGVEQQASTYSYPSDLRSNESFITTDDRIFLATNTKESLNYMSPEANGLPSQLPTLDDVKSINASIIDSGGSYSKIAKAVPEAIPTNTTKGRLGNPDSSGKWWVGQVPLYKMTNVHQVDEAHGAYGTALTKDGKIPIAYSMTKPCGDVPASQWTTAVSVQLFDERKPYSSADNSDEPFVTGDVKYTADGATGSCTTNPEADYNAITDGGVASPTWNVARTGEYFKDKVFWHEEGWNHLIGRGMFVASTTRSDNNAELASDAATKVTTRPVDAAGLLQTHDNAMG